MDVLTTEGDTVLKGLGKFRPDFNDLIPLALQLLLPVFLVILDDSFQVIGVEGVNYITDPLLIHPGPIPFIGEVLENVGPLLGQVQEILDGETNNIGDR